MRTSTLGARLAAAALTLVVLAGCSSGSDGSDAAAADDPAATTTTAVPAEVEAFTGTVDEFYEVPDPLPPGEPGDLIRTMPIEAADGEAGLRIMYHSTDAEGDDRAVTGVVYHPTGEAPAGGWPVLAWAHGTSGLAPPCAPSRDPGPPPAFGVEGVRVATDYIGLGPEGELHPYLSAAAEGNAVIDSVAAVHQLPEVEASDQWVVAGHSQGGHAVLATNETAAERLPEAELLGAVAIAPGAQLGETYGDLVQVDIITTMVLFGAAFEDPDLDVRDYLTAEAQPAVEEAVTDACLEEIIATVLPLAAQGTLWETHPRSGALDDAWLEANDPAQVVADAPLLVLQGGRDVVVVPARTDALVERLCRLGQVVEVIDYPDADHGSVVPQASDDAAAWIAARFAGEPAPDSC